MSTHLIAVQPPTLEEHLRTLLQYDPATGVISRRIEWHGRPAGSTVGWKNKDGYVMLKLALHRKKYTLFAHRVAWFLRLGVWPDGPLDHKNGIRNDNRIDNLRDGGDGVNQRNSGRRRSKPTGLPAGVFLQNHSSSSLRYRAQIKLAGVTYNLGSYETADTAERVYEAVKRVLHPEWDDGQGATLEVAQRPPITA